MAPLDAASIEARFSATEPKRRSLYFSYALVLGMLAGVILLPLARSARPQDEPAGFGPYLLEALGVLLLGVLVGVLLMMGWLAGRRRRSCRRTVVKAWERVQWGDWDRAREALDAVMLGSIQSPSDRGQAFMMLAATAEHAGEYGGSALIYQTLLLRRIGDPVHLQQAQIALAAAKIRNQELTDAVEYLGRLEQITMPAGLRATLDLVRLFQQVFMGHYEDAVEGIEERRLLFRRHLSTGAAYGYGLLAAAMHTLGRTEEAARLWRDATMLLEPGRLVEEYDLLAPISQAYAATRKPPGLTVPSGASAPAP